MYWHRGYPVWLLLVRWNYMSVRSRIFKSNFLYLLQTKSTDMKAEINIDNKARFFALYWGQKVWCNQNYYEFYVDFDALHRDHLSSTSYLLLKPLSSISDEDAIKIGFESSKEFLRFENFNTITEWYDELRYLGYAVDWLGLPVYEMVEAGWIKLVE